MSAQPWAITARHFLAEYRANPLTPDDFESAWAALLRKHRPPASQTDGWNAGTVAFAKAAFCEGFYRRDVIGNASILGEDYDYGDERGVGTIHGYGTVVA